MPDLILYRKDGACSTAAHMLLLELEVPFTAIPMKEGLNRLYEGADGTGLTREAFIKISPMGYVPALTVDGETTITELSAVLFYISSLAPERGMTGHDAVENAKVLQWMSWLSTTLNEYGFAGYWRPSRMVGLEASSEAEDAVRAEGKKTILKGFDILEGWLDGTGHAVGRHLTVVDFMLQ
ncbi:hypothetical protein M409DRAFT_19301 [Zasmidium cellare ATCC 36951]|uniref:GST N-terminal domain-containing protein n=1 Tax=Zasmidium cellare ATCC 36951 TaxID=1080233 RepID=A0A6A6CWA3_ZASCE|nr:uncharacterized protein M409DRAFT_19301 [Zasmidium cellare ATCC 36951]KAF2170480.1 hypothetical protein M409DRAFT_19301 [Zasmidium cellare ATCC 36951]